MKLILELSFLTEACLLDKNIDERKFKLCLKEAQENLRAVLGLEFYEEIEDQYPGSFTTDNNTLYEDYVKDFLAWQTYSEFIAFSQLDSTPTGFREHTDDNSTIAQDMRFFSLSKNVRIKADTYKNKIVNFLKLSQEQDSTKYPLYQGCSLQTFSFGITSVSGKNHGSFSVNKAITRQE